MLPQSPAGCFHPSNTLTYLSLVAGVGAIAAAAHGSVAAAGALIAVAAIADTFDGRLARRFPRSDSMRAFGAELDSLCDAAVFGAAPVVCSAWLNKPAAGPWEFVWWSSAFAYIACTVTRLGFYNLNARGAPPPRASYALRATPFGLAARRLPVAAGSLLTDDAEGFVGVPAPAAALLWASLQLAPPTPSLEAALFLLAGIAMVSPIRIPRPQGAGLAVFVLWPLGLLGAYAGVLLR
jgi:CDP-diacylglycerol---serine O-phosphatidyltransferase